MPQWQRVIDMFAEWRCMAIMAQTVGKHIGWVRLSHMCMRWDMDANSACFLKKCNAMSALIWVWRKFIAMSACFLKKPTRMFFERCVWHFFLQFFWFWTGLFIIFIFFQHYLLGIIWIFCYIFYSWSYLFFYLLRFWTVWKDNQKKNQRS